MDKNNSNWIDRLQIFDGIKTVKSHKNWIFICQIYFGVWVLKMEYKNEKVKTAATTAKCITLETGCVKMTAVSYTFYCLLKVFWKYVSFLFFNFFFEDRRNPKPVCSYFFIVFNFISWLLSFVPVKYHYQL